MTDQYTKLTEEEKENRRKHGEEYFTNQQHLRKARDSELNIEMFRVTLSFIADIERIASTGSSITPETLNLKNLLIDDLINNRNQNHG